MPGSGADPPVGRAAALPAVRPTPPRLELIRAGRAYGPTRALHGVSIALERGEIRAVVGENGAGKSTLLKVLSGRIRPDGETTLAVDGEDVDLHRYSPRVARELGISSVPQELAGIEPMTVAENIFLGRELRRGFLLDRREMESRARLLLSRVGSTVTPSTPLERLGIAQRQLIEIARALSLDSRVLALDEPTTALGDDERDRLFQVIHDLTSQGVAIVYVSHRLDEILEHCDTYTVLKDGETAGSGLIADVSRTALVEMMVGRELSETYPARADQVGDAQLRVVDLSVTGKLSDVCLEVHRGEIVGVAGLMGSGRTTLAKTIFGAIEPAGGTIHVGSEPGPFHSPLAALDAGIAYVPEDRRREGLALSVPVRANASFLALRGLLTRRSRLISSRSEKALVSELITELLIRTSEDGSDLVAHLSGGNQQKVVLGKWLEANPTILILDEPTRGIDVGAKEEIYILLRRLAEEGLAILLISSELIELLGMADRIVVIADGRVTGWVEGRDATEADLMRLATAGRSQTSAAV